MEFALWMVKQLKESKARGESVSLSDLLRNVKNEGAPRNKIKRPTKPSAQVGEEVVIG